MSRTGDIIISIAGSIGLIAPVPASLDGANLTENAAKLVPRDRQAYDAGFLAAQLRSPFAQNQISSHVGQVTIGKLALFRIEKLTVPLPPIKLQREFSRRVTAVERLKTAQRASLAELDALFASLQHRAFRGNGDPGGRYQRGNQSGNESEMKQETRPFTMAGESNLSTSLLIVTKGVI